MTPTKGVGLGLGAVVAGAVASCPIVQGAVLGALGVSGLLPFLGRFRPAAVLIILVCSALAAYSVIRLRRARRA